MLLFWSYSLRKGALKTLRALGLSVWWVASSSCLLKKAKDGGFLPGWRVNGRCGDGVVIFHLLFVDDTLVLSKPNQDQLTYLGYLCGLRPSRGIALTWKKAS